MSLVTDSAVGTGKRAPSRAKTLALAALLDELAPVGRKKSIKPGDGGVHIISAGAGKKKAAKEAVPPEDKPKKLKKRQDAIDAGSERETPDKELRSKLVILTMHAAAPKRVSPAVQGRKAPPAGVRRAPSFSEGSAAAPCSAPEADRSNPTAAKALGSGGDRVGPSILAGLKIGALMRLPSKKLPAPRTGPWRKIVCPTPQHIEWRPPMEYATVSGNGSGWACFDEEEEELAVVISDEQSDPTFDLVGEEVYNDGLAPDDEEVALLSNFPAHKSKTKSERDQKWATPPLRFESRFESGNLRKAIRKGETEYTLFMRDDVCSMDQVGTWARVSMCERGIVLRPCLCFCQLCARGGGSHSKQKMLAKFRVAEVICQKNKQGKEVPHCAQWFYFRVGNMTAHTQFTISIVNFVKPESMYKEGMRPLFYSRVEETRNAKGWYRVGDNIQVKATPESPECFAHRNVFPYFPPDARVTFTLCAVF